MKELYRSRTAFQMSKKWDSKDIMCGVKEWQTKMHWDCCQNLQCTERHSPGLCFIIFGSRRNLATPQSRNFWSSIVRTRKNLRRQWWWLDLRAENCQPDNFSEKIKSGGEKWIRNFVHRHLEISFRTPEKRWALYFRIENWTWENRLKCTPERQEIRILCNACFKSNFIRLLHVLSFDLRVFLVFLVLYIS